MNYVRRPLAAALIIASLALSACGGGGSSDTPDAGSSPDKADEPATTAAPEGGDAAGGGATEVKIADFDYDPKEAEVKVGDTVTFTNKDSAAHTATAKDDAPTDFDTGKIDGDGSAEVTFDEAGDYEYFCSIHEYMTGTIRVLE